MVEAAERELLNDVLRNVSRAFFLSMRVLPAGVREPISVAYLLARAADSLADAPGLEPTQRLEQLSAFKRDVAAVGNGEAPLFVDALAQHDFAAAGLTAGEGVLLRRSAEVMRVYAAFAVEDRRDVAWVVETLIGGMERDLATFPGAFAVEEELDDYIYRVAGCVGRFWTRVTFRHRGCLRRGCRRDAEEMERLGVGFGKGLQLTNILRDLPKDLQNGRCYLPHSVLAAWAVGDNEEKRVGVPSQAGRRRQLFRAAVPELRAHLLLTLDYFASARAYALALPRVCLRERLAVLWPILIGLGTLERLAGSSDWLDASKRVKVSRRWVYGAMLLSLVFCWSNTALSWAMRRMEDNVRRAATQM